MQGKRVVASKEPSAAPRRRWPGSSIGFADGGRATPHAVPLPGNGTPIEAGLRHRFETGLGTSLTDVRIHTDVPSQRAARALRARAFTLGSDICFAPQQFDLKRPEGRLRLAHEVVHSVQQRDGASGGGAVANPAAEHEAWQGANTVLAGRAFRVRQRVARQIQRDEADTPAIRPFSTRPEFQLQLDPEIEAMMLRMHIRRWMAGLWATGTPPSDTSTQTGPGDDAGSDTQSESDTRSVPSPEAAAAAGSAPQVGPTRERATPLPPAFLRPPPGADSQSPSPSVGALLTPFNARHVPAEARDVNEVMAIYRRNYRFVSFLPDLRSAVPGFIRPLIPSDWRKGLAETFTAATVDTQLRPHFPTQSEVTEQFIFHVTGVKTHWLPSLTLSRF